MPLDASILQEFETFLSKSAMQVEGKPHKEVPQATLSPLASSTPPSGASASQPATGAVASIAKPITPQGKSLNLKPHTIA
jgi:hypothetical protein